MNAFSQVIDHLKDEYAKLQIGRASAGLVESLLVESYGVTQPFKAVASITTPDARTVQIQPWDRAMLGGIERAIQESDLNINPTNNGVAVILNIPALTEERRRDLVKVVQRLAEEARIAVRNIRHDAMADYKRQEHDGDMSEDEQKRAENQLQTQVDDANKQIAELARQKEDSIMTL